MGYGAPYTFFSEKPAIGREGSGSISKNGGTEFRAFTNWFSELSFQEAVCWAYGFSKSRISEVFWQETYEDLQQTLKFKVADRQVEAVQTYEAVANVASQIFGGESSKPTGRKTPLADVPVKAENVAKTSYEAINMFKSIFGR